ncbi:hypothetical protein NECAME_01887 [Necator americanus]|uniref:Major facilitator superfamily (MFS) profile domain-containing protein n=1 Tax=Necator americanus TaxID=51031 RepID=W2TPZ0_NECAM|nr:hypothetical protein NECAME_01887 [Necator americanus]ETN83087.1 hypothetical protein NECAME_01887 [Necator americanus]
MSAVLMVVFTISSVIGATFVDKYPRRFLVIFSGILSNVEITGLRTYPLALGFPTLCFTREIFPRLKGESAPLKSLKINMRPVQELMIHVLASHIDHRQRQVMVLGPVSWFVAPELVPLKHKSLVFSLCFGANNVFIAATDFLAIFLFQKFGAIIFVGLFTIPSFLSLIFVYLYLPESKGKEIEGIIEEMLKKAKKSPLKDEDCTQRVRSGYQIFATQSSNSVVQ